MRAKNFAEIFAKLKIILKKHYLAVIFAVVCGLFIIGPQLVFIFKLSAEYQGIYMFNTDSETHYLARMQEAYDGHGWGNSYLYEYKDDFPTTLPSISEKILAYPGKILNISAANMSLFYKFFLPAVLFLLSYAFFWRLTKSKFWSITAPLVIFLGSSDIFSLPHFIRIFQWDQAYNLFAMYSRPVNPQFSTVFYWAFLHFLLSVLEKGRLKWFLLLAGVIGLSFYIYLYSWTFFLTASLVVAVLFLLIGRKDFFSKTLLASGLGVIIGVPIILHLIEILQNQYYPFVSVFLKMAERAPNVSKMGVLVTIIFLIYFFLWSKKSQIDYLLLGLLATTFVVTNQQLITGYQLQPGHFYFSFNTPIFVIALFWIGFNLSQKFWFRFFTFPAIALVVLSFANVFLIQQSTFIHQFDFAARQQKYAPILKWLDNNTQRDSVVVADEELSALIPAYTHNNVYWENSLICYIVPPERFLAALFLYLKLDRVTPVDFAQKNPLDFGGQISLVYPDVLIVDKIADLGSLSEKYSVYHSESFRENLMHYRADYFAWDKNKNSVWNLDQYRELKPVYQSGDIIIYQTI